MNRTRPAFWRIVHTLILVFVVGFPLAARPLLSSASTVRTPLGAAIIRPPVYAHRGGTSEYVENTRATFRASGTGRWETDVRFTSTGYPVLLHDPDLGRFGCPAVLIAEISTTEARRCKAANKQTITTLGQFVADVKAYDVLAMVELKTVPTEVQWGRLDSLLAPVKRRVIIQSFWADALVEASRRGYTTAFLTHVPATVADLPPGTDWYAPEWGAFTLDDVTAMHVAGIKVVTWTPSLAEWPDLPAGLDAIISNDINRTYRRSPVEKGQPRPYRP